MRIDDRELVPPDKPPVCPFFVGHLIHFLIFPGDWFNLSFRFSTTRIYQVDHEPRYSQHQDRDGKFLFYEEKKDQPCGHHHHKTEYIERSEERRVGKHY